MTYGDLESTTDLSQRIQERFPRLKETIAITRYMKAFDEILLGSQAPEKCVMKSKRFLSCILPCSCHRGNGNLLQSRMGAC